MAGIELNVKNQDEIKRLWKLGFKKREISRLTKIHRKTVSKYINQLSLDEPIPKTSQRQSSETEQSNWTSGLDWEKIRSEFLSGTSLNVIHEELLQSNQLSIQYSGFWKQVQKRIELSKATMVRIFRPGERAEIDYADGVSILDPATGEIKKTQFFVGVLCHSRYAFAEFTLSQKSCDFLQSHVNMFEYFGGTPSVVTPDNLKSAVTKAHRYDPVINQAYSRLAEHYQIAVAPARVKTPQDKAIVERTIQIFQRYFFMKIRNRTFTSLVELNKVLKEHLTIFNNKIHRIFKRSRFAMFQDEKSHLNSLPQDPYKVAVYHKAVLGRDCHLHFERNFYSAPHNLRGQTLDVWATGKVVEIYHNGERVGFHTRSTTIGRFTSDTSHYPPAQMAFAEENIQKIIQKSATVGPETNKLIQSLLNTDQPLRFLQRSQGIIALSWKYSHSDLEAACLEANRFENKTIQYLERVIKTRKGKIRNTEHEITERSHNPNLRGLANIH
jgi:transposase